MKPSSDHELEIARVVDERASQGNLPVTAIAEIAAQIPFTMSESETQFLIRYVVGDATTRLRRFNVAPAQSQLVSSTVVAQLESHNPASDRPAARLITALAQHQ